MRINTTKTFLSLFVVPFLFIILLPTPALARSTTYIGSYEVTTEDNGTKKEVVRIAGAMGKVVKSRVTGAGRAVEKNWEYTYYTTDIQGSTRQEITENKPIPKPNTYYAYGAPIPSASSGQALNAQAQKIEDTYTGQKKDEETNLMYYNARYYNPQTGIFLQADSVDDGFNKYQYVAGNPVNNVDPSGNAMIDHEGGGGGSPAKPNSSGLQLSGITNLTASTGTQLGSSTQTNSTVNNMTNLCDSNPEAPQCGHGDPNGFMYTMGGALVGSFMAPVAIVAPHVFWGTIAIVDTASTSYACITGDPDCMMDAMMVGIPVAVISSTSFPATPIPKAVRRTRTQLMLREQFGLPRRELRFEFPDNFRAHLMNLAEKNQIVIRQFHGTPYESMFYEYPDLQGLTTGHEIFLRDFADLGTMEHELVHALQNRQGRNLTGWRAEYEAFMIWFPPKYFQPEYKNELNYLVRETILKSISLIK